MKWTKIVCTYIYRAKYEYDLKIKEITNNNQHLFNALKLNLSIVYF